MMLSLQPTGFLLGAAVGGACAWLWLRRDRERELERPEQLLQDPVGWPRPCALPLRSEGQGQLYLRRATLADVPALRELEQGIVRAEQTMDPMIKSPCTYYDMERLVVSNSTRLIVAEIKPCSRWGRDGPAAPAPADASSPRLVATGYLQIRESNGYKTHARHGYLGFMMVDPRERVRWTDMLHEYTSICRHAQAPERPGLFALATLQLRARLVVSAPCW